MKITVRIYFFVIMMITSAWAQNRIVEPSPAVTGPAYDVSAGYTSLLMQIPAARHVRLNGMDLSGSMALGPRWGATVDASYLRSGNVLGINHPAYMLNGQGGPEFYPFSYHSTRTFVRALAGGALVDGAAPGKNAYFHGWLVHPSFTVGAGFEHYVSDMFGFRFNADYLRTSFYNSSGVVLPQNNFRLTVSLVRRLKNHQRSR